MSLMYFIVAPVFGKALYDRSRMISRAIKRKNPGAIKVNVFFLVLILVVGAGLVLLLQRSGT